MYRIREIQTKLWVSDVMPFHYSLTTDQFGACPFRDISHAKGNIAWLKKISKQAKCKCAFIIVRIVK